MIKLPAMTSQEGLAYIISNKGTFEGVASGAINFATLDTQQKQNVCRAVFVGSPICVTKLGKVKVYDVMSGKYFSADLTAKAIPESITEILKHIGESGKVA